MGKFIVVLSSKLLEEIQQNLVDSLVDYSKRFKQAYVDGSLEFHVLRNSFDKYILCNDQLIEWVRYVYINKYHKILSEHEAISKEMAELALSIYPGLPPIKIVEKNNGISNLKEE